MSEEPEELEEDEDTGCTYVEGSIEPCENCPRRITALHMCKLLQEKGYEEDCG